MSRGLGILQRRLLANLERRDPPEATARQLALDVLAQDYPDDLAAVARHTAAADAAVRRALRTMAKRGLVVRLAQPGKGIREALVGYGLPRRPEAAHTVLVHVLRPAVEPPRRVDVVVLAEGGDGTRRCARPYALVNTRSTRSGVRLALLGREQLIDGEVVGYQGKACRRSAKIGPAAWDVRNQKMQVFKPTEVVEQWADMPDDDTLRRARAGRWPL